MLDTKKCSKSLQAIVQKVREEFSQQNELQFEEWLNTLKVAAEIRYESSNLLEDRIKEMIAEAEYNLECSVQINYYKNLLIHLTYPFF